MTSKLFGPGAAPKAAPPPPPAMHPCEFAGCTAPWGSFGFDVETRRRWFCQRHRSAGEMMMETRS